MHSSVPRSLPNLLPIYKAFRRLWEQRGANKNPFWILFLESGEKLEQNMFSLFYVLLMGDEQMGKLRIVDDYKSFVESMDLLFKHDKEAQIAVTILP